MRMLRRFFLPLLLVVVLGGALAVALWPATVPVDTARVARGALLVTVDDDGRTRVKDRYVVFTPLSGRMERIPLKAGDPIEMGKTILATIDPSDPALLDARAQAEAEARVKAAEATLARAEPQLRGASAALEHAQMELARTKQADAASAVGGLDLEQRQLAVTLREQEAKAAEFARQIATFELEQARAALLRTRPAGSDGAAGARFQIPSPITGRILRVVRDSEGAVGAGTALLEIGDTGQLEIEVDVLSQDAVRVPAHAPVIIERWGGETPLHGRVRLVEPSGFLKISALGVEEQRVNVIIDFVDPPDKRASLGDGYRVEARIVVDEARDAVVCPSGGLFRHAGGWAAFRVEGGRAVRVPVTVGRRNDREAEVLGGLAPDDELVVYPSDRVEDGVRVRAR